MSMEPEIRYTTTADGVSIAYYTMGEGLPLVETSNVVWSHLRGQLAREYHRSSSGQGLGRGMQFVRYDARGTGLSDRNTLDFSMEGRLLDIDAVVEQLKLERFALLSFVHGTPAAIAYAAAHRERVSHLIVHSGYASGRVYRERIADILLRDEDWERYTLNTANWILGFTNAELAPPLAAMLRQSMTPASLRAFVAAFDDIDVTPLLAGIAVPTLVMYRERSYNTSQLEWSRELASKIPGARFVEIAQRAGRGWSNEESRVVEQFLGVEHQATPGRTRAGSLPSAPGMTAILFADIADSTALTERMGDAAFRDASRALDEQLRAAIRGAGGTPIEGRVLGDGVMATFVSASQAIAAALRCREVNVGGGLQLHLGIHAGDVIREPANVYGGAVNIASRICGLSAPGEILVSDVVRGMARSSAGVGFEDRGEQEMKGVGEPVRVYAVRSPE